VCGSWRANPVGQLAESGRDLAQLDELLSALSDALEGMDRGLTRRDGELRRQGAWRGRREKPGEAKGKDEEGGWDVVDGRRDDYKGFESLLGKEIVLIISKTNYCIS
jgi:hypothetical protein